MIIFALFFFFFLRKHDTGQGIYINYWARKSSFFFFFTVEKRYAKRPPFLAKNEMGERKEKLAETG